MCVDDYNFGLRSNVVTIPAGSNTMLLSISLRNDDILEGNEIFRLMIDSTYNSDIVESRQYETVVTIIDTTGKFQILSFVCICTS